jgi:ribosome maturation protein SDO1
MTDKFTVVRLTLDGDRFELLVKPDPALEYKLGKRSDLSSVLVSDEIYSDANKGSRASGEKLIKHFKTADQSEIARQILARGELNLTTDQRRKMVEEKRRQIVQYINKPPSSSCAENRSCDGRSKSLFGSVQEGRRSGKGCD